MMKKAYGYVRVSGKAQVDGDGFERQEIALKRYAATQGIKVVEVFREKAVTGKSEWADRAAWVEMLGRMVSDGVKTIIIERLDRLARDLMVQEHILVDLRERGITLISAYEPDLCIDDPTRKLLRQIMGAIAEYDRAMIVLKLRGARERMRAREGRCEGRKGYGARPGEMERLTEMRRWWQEGASGVEIVRRCEARGWKAQSGGKWQVRVVLRLMRGN
jgi:DNA invertase Pin-like site-specific DNA recombinase